MKGKVRFVEERSVVGRKGGQMKANDGIKSQTYAWNLLEELQNLPCEETGLGLVFNIHFIDRFAPFQESVGIVRVLLHKCLGLLILIGLVVVLTPIEMESFVL